MNGQLKYMYEHIVQLENILEEAMTRCNKGLEGRIKNKDFFFRKLGEHEVGKCINIKQANIAKSR